MTAHLTRNARIWWSRWLIASLLFLQLASAAYACAMQSAGTGASSMAGMPCAEAVSGSDRAAMDPDQPGLCHEHCKGGTQTTEPAAPVALAVPALAVLFVVATAAEPLADTSAWRARRLARDSAPPPSHALLHCCLRL